MNTQFKKGIIELCVLHLIYQKDRYGYELVEVISQQIEVSEGTIYPILRRLTQEGYFETYIAESSGGPARKYYRITNAGRSYHDELYSSWVEFNQSIEKLLKEEDRK